MLKRKFNHFFNRFVGKLKKMRGNPHYVSLGMAIGVFVAITPTIPFHTILAIFLAILFKASKPAAILGVWVSNPFTVIFLYFACYKTGHIFWEGSPSALESIEVLIGHLEDDIKFFRKMTYLREFIQTQIRTFLIMNAGGVILGIPAGAIAYFVTKRFMAQLPGNGEKPSKESNDTSGTAFKTT